MNRNCVYTFPSVHNTCNVVVYCFESHINPELISFIQKFDVWKSYGNYKREKPISVWFECSKEFFEILHTDTMKQAFNRMGFKLIFEYPFTEEFEKQN